VTVFSAPGPAIWADRACVGGVVPSPEHLKTLTEGDRASGARVEPVASHVHFLCSGITRDDRVRVNTNILNGAGLNGTACPGVGAGGVASAPGDGQVQLLRGKALVPGAVAQGANGARTLSVENLYEGCQDATS